MWNRDDNADKKPLKAPQSRGTGSGRPATIGASIAVRGELVGREDLTIDGTFEGDIQVSGCLVTVGTNGQVEGRIRAKVIAIEGQVRGDLIAEDQIVVRASGRMEGDIQAPRVALDEGCQFKGNIDMEPDRKQEAKSDSAADSKSETEPESKPPEGATAGDASSTSPEGNGTSDPKSDAKSEVEGDGQSQSTESSTSTPGADQKGDGLVGGGGPRGRHQRRNRRR